MDKRMYLVVCLLAGGVAHGNGLPPVQYVNGAPNCPRDLDIKNIDTRLSARVVPADNMAALHQERDKAVRCRTLGTRYSPEDWKRMNAVIRGDK